MNIRIKIALVIIALGIAGGAWWYQTKKTSTPQVGQEDGMPAELTPYKHLFVFENFDPQLPDAARENYFKRFTEASNALRTDSTNFNAWLEIGKVHKNLNAFEKARDAWVRLGEVSPLNSISFGNLGDLYAWFLQDPKKGEEAYLQALKNEPDEINYRRNLAELYAKLLYRDAKEIQIEKVVPLLEEGTKTASTEVERAEMAALLGSYYRDWGDRENAVKWYKKTLEIDPKYPNRSIIQDEIDKLSK